MPTFLTILFWFGVIGLAIVFLYAIATAYFVIKAVRKGGY